MDQKGIRETSIWTLFEKGQEFHRTANIYADTNRNHEFYNGNQWMGAKLGGIEPVVKNFVMPIVKYKVAVIHDNLYAIHYSPQCYESSEFQREAKGYCDLLNRYAHRIWELSKMDFLGRRITKDAAINDEGILYVDFDKDKKLPINQVIDKTDIYYGNENDDDIQAQPYILIRKRLPQVAAIELAKELGIQTEDIPLIVPDNFNFEQPGYASRNEVDDMVTVVYKLYRENGTVRFSAATRYCDIVLDQDLGIKRYPVAHFCWEQKKGSARGEGEVRRLIPNQIEVNRTEMRRVLTAKYQAYPIRVVDESKISNVNAIHQAGGVLKTNGQTVDDVRKVVGVIQPAQMSTDVKMLVDDLINTSRELAGAGDSATGQINPETASGRAILAVQQASQAPMTEQKETYKNFIEDVAHIWLEYMIVHSADGIQMEKADKNPTTGEETISLVPVPQSALQRLQAQVKIDVTPKSVYDRIAQEQTIENLLVKGFFKPENMSQLEIYYKVLPDDAVAPKLMIGEALDYMKSEQKKIAMLQVKANALQQNMSRQLSELQMARMPAGQMSPMQAEMMPATQMGAGVAV